MNADEERLKKLLQQALPPVGDDPETAPDLWPAMLRRLDTGQPESVSGWVWFDGALLVGLVGAVAVFPTAIPVLLYYL
jgi:hypothetical protein